MISLREKLQMVGLGFILVGLLCLPLTPTSAKSTLSAFNLFAGLGFLWKFGLGVSGFGVCIFGAAFLVKR